MTREELIARWADDIIPAVLVAEERVRDELQQILADHADDPTTAAELYTHAIAEEIVGSASDEEISKMYN